MLKNKKLLLIIGLVALVACVGVVLGVIALNGDSGAQSGGQTKTYEIKVTSAAGVPVADLGLYIYEDSSMKELVSFIKTDAEGKTSFTDVARKTYVAVIDKVPTGYEAEAYYAITGDVTEIVLRTGKMSDADVDTLTYKLGDAVLDFSVTGPDGTVYTLSELFKDKKAVVLNFFYNSCDPCRAEFPHLQEAYAEYADQIVVLAMNPVDGDDAAVAALQKELGITFPMVKCGPEWEKIMQISAYPTTVIIDRYGMISLIHTGSITEPQVFKDAFAFFCADDYVHTPVKDILELAIEKPEGTEENPNEVGGQTGFEATVEPGQVVYFELYKVFNMYLQIKSEDAYVIYNGKTFYPENGVVGLMVSAPDSFTPAKIGIGNSSTETKTFQVTLSSLKGSFDNPYSMSLGLFDVRINAGNEQGVYYTYTAPADGTLKLKCVSVSSGIKYSYYLYNTVNGAMRNLEGDAVYDEAGVPTISVTAKKGQLVQICVSTLPDNTNNYPAGYFTFEAVFEEGEVKEQEVIIKIPYNVTVTDEAGNPVPNVSVVVTNAAGEQTAFTTDETGVAGVLLVPGDYTGKIYIPDGYTAETVDFKLTEAKPDVQLQIRKIRMLDYTVQVVGPTGETVANVFTRIGDGAWQRTDAEGKLTANLREGAYQVTILVPSGYSGETTYAFAENAQALTITLGHPYGSQENPHKVEAYPFSVGTVAAGEQSHCYVYPAEDMLAVSIYDASAYIQVGSTTYGPDANGIVRVPVDPAAEAPILMLVGNSDTAAHSFKLEAEYPWGTEKYPQKVTGATIQVTLDSGDADGHYYSYTPDRPGIFSVQVQPQAGLEITLQTGETLVKLSESETAGVVTLETVANEPVVIHVTAEEAVSLELALDFVGTGDAPEPKEKNYQVTLTDAFGAAQTGVEVIFLLEGNPVASMTTDENGTAMLTTETAGTYHVELFFNGTDYYYDKTAAVLDDTNRSITLKLYEHLDQTVFQDIYILNGNPAYELNVGGTHVQVGSGRPNFSAEYGNNCFFVFTPAEPGTYQITAGDPNVLLSFWGTTNFINQQYTSQSEGREGALTESISEGSIGHVSYVIGVHVEADGIADVVLNVARIGDPEFSIADQPWSEWQTGEVPTDKWKTEIGLKPVQSEGEVAYYELTGKINYLDIAATSGTYDLYYDAANGYYRLYQGGPVVMVNLNATGRYVPLYERINGNGQYGGSSVTGYFYDSTGAFLRKENYTEYFEGCFAEVQLDNVSETGYYPLTKDMMHALQNGFAGWWNPESPNYLSGFETANKEYAWMFACFYVTN